VEWVESLLPVANNSSALKKCLLSSGKSGYYFESKIIAVSCGQLPERFRLSGRIVVWSGYKIMRALYA
jgi:hypothetical protein